MGGHGEGRLSVRLGGEPEPEDWRAHISAATSDSEPERGEEEGQLISQAADRSGGFIYFDRACGDDDDDGFMIHLQLVMWEWDQGVILCRT
jgi:hypothetical protein